MQPRGSRRVCPHIDPGTAFPFTIGFTVDDRHADQMVHQNDWIDEASIERDTLHTHRGKILTMMVSMKASNKGTRNRMEHRVYFGLPKGRLTCEAIKHAMLVNNEELHGIWERVFLSFPYDQAVRALSLLPPYCPEKQRVMMWRRCAHVQAVEGLRFKTVQKNSRSLDVMCGTTKMSFRQRSEDNPHGLCLDQVNPEILTNYCRTSQAMFDVIGNHLVSTLPALTT